MDDVDLKEDGAILPIFVGPQQLIFVDIDVAAKIDGFGVGRSLRKHRGPGAAVSCDAYSPTSGAHSRASLAHRV